MNTNSESNLLQESDAKVRKLGEQTGLDTLVVLAVNNDYSIPDNYISRIQAKALSNPPGKYISNDETQRN